MQLYKGPFVGMFLSKNMERVNHNEPLGPKLK